MSWKDLYSEVKKRKMEALNKKNVVKFVEEHGRILAVEGQFEKVEKIIKHMYVSEYKIIEYQKEKKDKNIIELLQLDLNRYDVILIGCPGRRIPNTAYSKILDYVSNGGWLLTTDWALSFIIENIFPGYIRWNRNKTRGHKEIVTCQILEPNHPFLDGVLSEIQQNKWSNQSMKATKKSEFRWWLEIESYPIKILNYDAVKVLIESQEIKNRYGEAPVLLSFDYGNRGGRIIHMISHTHLQKGGTKGKYVSALILTNIVDEKVSQKMGISRPSQGYVSDWEAPYAQQQSSQPPLEDQWVALPEQNNYVTPTTAGRDFGQTRISQIVEANDNNFSFASKCAYCGNGFADFMGKIYVCKECKAPYHENCLNFQINEGVCKNCDRILLW